MIASVLANDSPARYGRIGRHRVEGVDNRDDPCVERDRLADQAVRIAAPIPAFVVVADGREDFVRRPQWRANLRADDRVVFENVVFRCGQHAGLAEDRFRHGDFSDIVEGGGHP